MLKQFIEMSDDMLLGTVLSAAQALVYMLLMFIYMRKEGYFDKTKVRGDSNAPAEIAVPGTESAESAADKEEENKDSDDPPDKAAEDLSKKSYSYGQSVVLTAVMFLSCFLINTS